MNCKIKLVIQREIFKRTKRVSNIFYSDKIYFYSDKIGDSKLLIEMMHCFFFLYVVYFFLLVNICLKNHSIEIEHVILKAKKTDIIFSYVVLINKYLTNLGFKKLVYNFCFLLGPAENCLYLFLSGKGGLDS